jgi:hypothetical protein
MKLNIHALCWWELWLCVIVLWLLSMALIGCVRRCAGGEHYHTMGGKDCDLELLHRWINEE